MYCDTVDPLEAGLIVGATVGYYSQTSYINYPKTNPGFAVPGVGFPQTPVFLQKFAKQIGVMLKPNVAFITQDQVLNTNPSTVNTNRPALPERVYTTELEYIGLPYFG